MNQYIQYIQYQDNSGLQMAREERQANANLDGMFSIAQLTSGRTTYRCERRNRMLLSSQHEDRKHKRSRDKHLNKYGLSGVDA